MKTSPVDFRSAFDEIVSGALAGKVPDAAAYHWVFGEYYLEKKRSLILVKFHEQRYASYLVAFHEDRLALIPVTVEHNSIRHGEPVVMTLAELTKLSYNRLTCVTTLQTAQMGEPVKVQVAPRYICLPRIARAVITLCLLWQSLSFVKGRMRLYGLNVSLRQAAQQQAYVAFIEGWLKKRQEWAAVA